MIIDVMDFNDDALEREGRDRLAAPAPAARERRA
jgi:hypothetical protein